MTVAPLFTLTGAVRHHRGVAAWWDGARATRAPELVALAHRWYGQLKCRADDVLEVMHDGAPTLCVGDCAFAYVNIFAAHANLGFFYGAFLPDPGGLLQGSGRRMRHVKLRAGHPPAEEALLALIGTAHGDARQRLERAKGAE